MAHYPTIQPESSGYRPHAVESTQPEGVLFQEHKDNWLLRELARAHVEVRGMDGDRLLSVEAAKLVFNRFGSQSKFRAALQELAANPPFVKSHDLEPLRVMIGQLKRQTVFSAVRQSLEGPQKFDGWLQAVANERGLNGLMQELLRTGRKKNNLRAEIFKLNQMPSRNRSQEKREKLVREQGKAELAYFALVGQLADKISFEDLPGSLR